MRNLDMKLTFSVGNSKETFFVLNVWPFYFAKPILFTFELQINRPLLLKPSMFILYTSHSLEIAPLPECKHEH